MLFGRQVMIPRWLTQIVFAIQSHLRRCQMATSHSICQCWCSETQGIYKHAYKVLEQIEEQVLNWTHTNLRLKTTHHIPTTNSTHDYFWFVWTDVAEKHIYNHAQKQFLFIRKLIITTSLTTHTTTKQWCMYCSTCSKPSYEHSYLLHFCSWTKTKHVFEFGCPLNLCNVISKNMFPKSHVQ